jgi:hypothetical protein
MFQVIPIGNEKCERSKLDMHFEKVCVGGMEDYKLLK